MMAQQVAENVAFAATSALNGESAASSSAQEGAESVPAFDRTTLIGANINPDTLLATDYLNHFNEVGMLLEMLPEMPDCIEELEDWAPRSYVDHFAWSGLRYSDLAIEAYQAASPAIRAALEDVIGRLNIVVLEAIPLARHAIESEDAGELYTTTTVTAQSIRGLIDEASGIINGSAAGKPGTAEPGNAQDAINALFD